MNQELKKSVKDFWNEASCGEKLYLAGFSEEDYLNQSKKRYELEPEIIEFGEFHRFKGLKTLEIGVGLGSDHMKLAQHGAILNGIDLTHRAISHTRRRFELLGLESTLQVIDAEDLPFENSYFDAIYSWGVIHHSPNTSKIVKEIYRVLKSGGFAKIMIYHKYSLVGYMLWLKYALLRFRPWKSLKSIYSQYLESPGTKAYTYSEARKLFAEFNVQSIDSPLTHGDLLTSDVGQNHRGAMLDIAKKVWPRWLFRLLLPKHGLFLMIEIEKNRSSTEIYPF